MNLRNILTSLLVMTAIIVGVMLLFGDPIRVWTVLRVLIVAALGSAFAKRLHIWKAARG